MSIMKKRIVAVFLSVACMVGLCLALVGCGGQEDNFVGEWELESIKSDSLGSVDAAALHSVGMSSTLTVNEDGSAALDLFGSDIDCTWEANGAATMTLTIAGQGDAVFVLSADDKLSSDDGDTTMTFVRAE